MTDDVAKIAAGLSEAGKRSLIEARQWHWGQMSAGGPPSTLHALKRKGLTSGVYASRLTPLGLDVRAHLKGQDHD